MAIVLTQLQISELHALGVSTLLGPGSVLPDDVVLEPPCSLKWMNVQHSLRMGAFSYAVSGYYFGCLIGRYCSIGEQVQIGRHPHPLHYFSTSPFFYMRYRDVVEQDLPEGQGLDVVKDFKRTTPPVTAKMTTIGNDVWIGHGAFILPGVTVGDGAVIAAQSVVTKDVPPYAVVAGSPATVKKYRFPQEQIERLLQLKWWEFAPWQMKGAMVDNIPRFMDFVATLRSSGEATYLPQAVNLRSVLKTST